MEGFFSISGKPVSWILPVLQRAAPLFEKARSFRLIEIGEQFCTNMDRLDCAAAIRRYHAFRAETEAGVKTVSIAASRIKRPVCSYSPFFCRATSSRMVCDLPSTRLKPLMSSRASAYSRFSRMISE